MRTDSKGNEPWVKDLHNFVSRGPGVLIRLRGLPYDCMPSQVVDFFRRGDFPAEVVDGEKGVYFVKKQDGRSTGDALVQFENEAAAAAALTKQKHLIGTRYIELFRIAVGDVEQVVRRTLELKKPLSIVQRVQPPQANMIPFSAVMNAAAQGTFPCGPGRDCIQLRGLPYETQVQNLLDFMGAHATNIILQGVHMIYNHVGQPTGEAFVQMTSENAACLAATQCNGTYLTVGKKQRYIEVFPCSTEEMASYLMGNAPPPSLPSSGIEDVLPPFYPMVPNMMEHGFSTPPPQMSSSPPGSMVYVWINPSDNFIPLPPTPEWIPEFPSSPSALALPPPPFPGPFMTPPSEFFAM